MNIEKLFFDKTQSLYLTAMKGLGDNLLTRMVWYLSFKDKNTQTN